ncbi:hypothetical protein AB205_0006980 [Aquarana catesbeiana]|uniref:Uncharacterized protein n=1 Tax=Aquarana catesbeiana TaxID=8400 RepID=A0A2G9Q9D3_AQUCT|nr:hypothetical protein AB205_0006980 [Aquarana catesbeiana]
MVSCTGDPKVLATPLVYTFFSTGSRRGEGTFLSLVSVIQEYLQYITS